MTNQLGRCPDCQVIAGCCQIFGFVKNKLAYKCLHLEMMELVPNFRYGEILPTCDLNREFDMPVIRFIWTLTSWNRVRACNECHNYSF